MPSRPKSDKPKAAPVRRVLGYLVCDTCQRTISYQGTPEPIEGSEGWPKHRCSDLEVRDFNRFELEDPYRPTLPPAAIETQAWWSR